MRDRIRKTGAACHLCGEAIDYTLPHTNPRSFVIDHLVPLSKGGEDALHNVKAAHRQSRLQQRETSSPHPRNHPAIRITRPMSRGRCPGPLTRSTSGVRPHLSPTFFSTRMESTA
ncbi:HNH endonuclease [Leifsonia sp. 1010]|uniref:HNH endonuclease n=1 Tax=Leifsonia sp. 1010 TaxID=2817769 RepID=UPI0037C0146A